MAKYVDGLAKLLGITFYESCEFGSAILLGKGPRLYIILLMVLKLISSNIRNGI